MQKVLVICGPTATGKTNLALNIATKLNGDLLVADSKQVYRGLDIVTSKDIPIGSHFVQGNPGYWVSENNVRIWLLDLVNPEESFSVSVWYKVATKVLRILEKEKTLPIVVGGTGLYIKSLSGAIDTIDIPPNINLRATLASKNISELYDILAQVDSVKAASMNHSDKHNPLRLIRAIEVADFGKGKRKKVRRRLNILKIGLFSSKELMFIKIDMKVDERIKNGAIIETKRLIDQGLDANAQSMTSVGYKQLLKYFKGLVGLDEAVKMWKNEEHKYALRQMTWFKKDKEIEWFDVTRPEFLNEVEKIVANWYNKD